MINVYGYGNKYNDLPLYSISIIEADLTMGPIVALKCFLFGHLKLLLYRAINNGGLMQPESGHLASQKYRAPLYKGVEF